MKNSILLSGVVGCLVLAPIAAAAQDISAAEPITVVRALQTLGNKATLTTDSNGDPMVESTLDGINYTIFFYGCNEAHADCRWLQFSAGFNLDAPFPLEQINAWNRDRLFGEATIDDEGDPYLSFFFSAVGGVSEENFEDLMLWWDVALDQYKEHINW
jgi:hypothetical protein